MIDTVVLELPFMDYHITDHEQFNPPTHNVAQSRVYLLKYVNNPTSQDRKDGLYKPRLTITKRRVKGRDHIPLRIEFSVPKLIFGNNLDELHDADFSRVANTLQKILQTMGVSTTIKAIMSAKVSAVHYSKNVQLSDGSTASFAIKELSKINLTQKLDLSSTQFRNEGHSLQYYSNCHSFVIYDKIKDIAQTKGHAIDKDQTLQQLTLFDLIEGRANPLEILRLEVRISKRTKLKTLMTKLKSPNADPEFKDVFSSKLAQAVLKHYWKEMVTENNLFLFVSTNEPQQMLKVLLRAGYAPKEAFYLLGIITASKDKGLRELRKMLGKHASKRSWDRIKKDFATLNSLSTVMPLYNFMDEVNTSLELFKPYKLQKESLPFL